MKLLIAFLVFLGAAFAQNPNSCSQVQNAATSGQVLSAATSGRPPQCKWITGSGGGGSPAAPNSSLQFNDSSAFGGNSSFTVNKVTKGWTLNKLSCTGTPVTCTLYDDTATTGISKLVIRSGAAQTTAPTDPFSIEDNSGNQIHGVATDGGFFARDPNNAYKKKVAMDGTSAGGLVPSLDAASDAKLLFKNVDDLDSAGSYDVGLCRGAAGQINVNDGSATCANLAAFAAASMKTGSSAPTCAAGTGGPICLHEGTAVTGESGADNCSGDSTAHAVVCSFNNDALKPLSRTIASGTATLGTGAITNGTCATAVTVSATGVLTTDAITFSPNASLKAITGFTPGGGLSIREYPTADNVNFEVCNETASPITPGSAVTLNWRVGR